MLLVYEGPVQRCRPAENHRAADALRFGNRLADTSGMCRDEMFAFLRDRLRLW